MKTIVLLLTFLLSVSLHAQPEQPQAHRGSIIGQALDAKTFEPIPQLNAIVVEHPSTGTVTDTAGRFTIRDLSVGTYSLKISGVGYIAKIVTDVVVTTGRVTPVSVKLEQTAIEMEGVTTQVSYFTKAQELSTVSSNVYDRAEILRSPGSIQDVQRVAQNLPGVASSNDNVNELIVRGGAPFENLTIMDHMEIPSINHYSNEYNSAGPINMVNADMIEDVQFSSGGFPAQYGDKSSSVMNLSVREGNRNKAFASKTAMSFAGIGTLVEGGFDGGKGSYILSARNSLLEVINSLMGMSVISLTAVPKYWDMQSKITYDLSPSNKLSLNVLYGNSKISFDGDPTKRDELRSNMIDSSTIVTLAPVQQQYAAGLNLRSLHGKDGYSLLTLYSSGSTNDIDVREDFAIRPRDGNGDVISTRRLNNRPLFSQHADQSILGAKYELYYQIHPRHSLSAGAQLQTDIRWNEDVVVAADTARYDLAHNGAFSASNISPKSHIHERLNFGYASKYFAYLGDKFSIAPQLSLTFGLRYDHFTYSGNGSLSPRASVAYEIIPMTTTLTFSTGTYYQTHPLPYYSDQRDIGYNRNLEPMRADHYVLGLEHYFDAGLKLSFESYYKKYSGVAVSEEFLHPNDYTLWSDRLLTVGERKAYGIEFYLEQKQVQDYFGTVSLSLSKSTMTDPRIPPLVQSYPSDYDYPVVLTLLGGKVVKGTRDAIDNTTFFLKYLTYILPFSNEMEFSVKYRFQTGAVYTPVQYVSWKQTRVGGLAWSSGAWVSTNEVNSVRYPDYSRLDLQWLSRYYHDNYNINVIVSLMNILGTKNVFYEDHRSDGTVETVYQFAFFPVLGVEVEF